VAGGVPIDNIKVIYPAVEIPHPSGSSAGRSFTLGFLGRLTEEKGVDILLRSLAKLPADTNLIIAGSGPKENELKKQVLELNLSDRVSFLGRVTDKAQFFNQIGALVVPSFLAESFGLVAVEAMAFGVPVIASRIGALSEIIENEKTGLLFEPGNADDLAKKISDLRANPAEAEKMTGFAAAAVSVRFSSEGLVKKFLALL
jgi:glycosyltransferase involved in cell wall biosynthesis